MGNHVHLLIKESSETLAQIMKRISSTYVYYYNHKYGRIGHLFQERFKSQPVGDWDYFLTLLRYIHQNPLKPHLVTSFREYRWSSWLEYIGQEKNALCATNVVLSRISLEELSNLIAEPLAERRRTYWYRRNTCQDILLWWRNMACTHKSVWHNHSCWVSAIATTAAEALSLGSPWKRNWASRIVPPYRRTIFHRAKGNKCRKWENTPVGNGCESTLEDEDWYSYCSPDEFEPYPEY